MREDINVPDYKKHPARTDDCLHCDAFNYQIKKMRRTIYSLVSTISHKGFCFVPECPFVVTQRFLFHIRHIGLALNNTIL